MSVPTSKLLKANKSLVATANLKHMSPNFDNSQQQSVSIVVNNSSPDLTKTASYPEIDVDQDQKPTDSTEFRTTRGAERAKTEPQPDTKVSYFPEENPYDSIATRDLASAQVSVEELSKLIADKENIIKAQSIIIDMFQNNPIIVNRYIVATEETLIELIKLLTGAEIVEIELADIECTCTQPKFAVIKKIFLTVKGEIYSIDLCPAVLRLFESYKISLQFIAF